MYFSTGRQWASQSLSLKWPLLTQVATVLATAALAYSVGKGYLQSIEIAMGAAFAIASVSLLLLSTQITRSAQWERRIASLFETNEIADTLVTSSGTSRADFGWNRLVELGRRWCSLNQLQQSLAHKLTQACSGSSYQLLDALPEGVAAVDRSGTITYANAVLAAICGRANSSEMHGRSLSAELGVDDMLAQQINNITSVQQSIVEWSMTTETSTRTLRGERRPVVNGDGHTCFVWIIRDVSQQRLAESMREKFLAAATHEFRTPLANIRAYSESLDMGDDFDRENRKKFYNVIQSESIRLSQLVDDLLDISRIQAGALALDLHETDLGRLIEEASGKLQGQMREKDLQFRVELPPKFPKASLDKGKLSAALVNLLGNAAKYTPAGGRVTFRVDITSENIQFSVTDTGIGIAPDELHSVFDRFFRSSDDRVRGISGSGLGLALAQEIARLHGGDITVESTLNVGSTFRMSIPLSLAA